MPEFAPELLARWTDGRWTEEPGRSLTGFAIDTRQLKAGEVFVALRTDKRDGHDFLAAAREAGASAALVSRRVEGVALPQLVVNDPAAAFRAIAREHRRRFDGPVIGVTGSAGKTSTKNLLALLLGPRTLATEGNLNNTLGVPLTLTRLDPAQHRYAVIEAGISEPGEMELLARMIEPDVAIVTLVAPAHTQDLGGLAGVAQEKALLPARVRESGVAIFHADLRQHAAFRELPVAALHLVRLGQSGQEALPRPVEFSVEHRGNETVVHLHRSGAAAERFSLRRVSDGMAENAALALTAALWLGESPAALQPRLATWTPGAMRGEIRRTETQLLYLDCYNANPASMRDALAVFTEIAPARERRLYVLGGMEELGAESGHYHHQLGATLRLREQDMVYVIGDEAEAVRTGALAAGARPGQVTVVTSLAPVQEQLREFRGAVFLKGSRKYRLESVLGALQPEAAPGATH